MAKGSSIKLLAFSFFKGSLEKALKSLCRVRRLTLYSVAKVLRSMGWAVMILLKRSMMRSL